MARDPWMTKLGVYENRVLPALVLAMLCAIPAVSRSAFAQSNTQQSTATQASPDQKQEESQGPTETIKVGVNVVQLFFNVKDKHGALIPNLTKNDFEIAEDGKPQTIKYFTDRKS